MATHAEKLRLFFITYTDEDGENFDWFVTAKDYRHAFELWRKYHEIVPGQQFEDRQATVWPVPPVADVPGLEGWETLCSQVFLLNS